MPKEYLLKNKLCPDILNKSACAWLYKKGPQSKHIAGGNNLEGKTCLYNHFGGAKALFCHAKAGLGQKQAKFFT